MAINRGPWNALVDDDGSNLVGSVWNKAAIKDVILDPTDAALVAGDPWVDRVFDGARFLAPSGSWTVTAGQALVNSYVKIGKTIVFSLSLGGTVVTGSPGYLILYTHDFLGPSPRYHASSFHYWCSGYTGTGYAEWRINEPAIWLNRDVGGTPFAATGNLFIRLTVIASIP